ncbi:MAG: BrnA antitoxin family protein [Rhodoferax sp.]|uniref:BrnA antitoxin family protein n=1 Tax=Rhodoferax sp. TaxID=50421 RepID=UPI001B581F6A|nr:BrnA antitoxin family protein [Rhodoferax sp.]MBP9685429.1 BrnA antitoxin family protein [Rhodoferax sp.]MBP9907621.1 BrnA antitoxin family protein [Rhodoferax sp.]
MNKKPNPELVDDENPEWTDEMFNQSVRLDGLPASLQAKLRGRPKAIVTKEAVKLRLDADVLAALRASGDGWQTRINDTLRASLHLAGRV